MEECVKGSQRQVYKLPQSPEEIRINNYNPLLLMFWKANMDMQFIEESTKNCAVRHWLCDKGREEQHARALAGGLLSPIDL